MDLKEYIKATIVSISEAIEESQEVLGEKGVLINPESIRPAADGHRALGTTTQGFTHLTDLEFDILVGVEEGTAGGGGAKLKVAGILNIGADLKGTEKLNSSNRLKFSIPIAYTTSKVNQDTRSSIR